MKYKEVMQNPNITWISNDAISKRINAEFYDVEIGNVVNKMKQVFGDNIKNLTEFIILKDTGRNYLDTNQSNSYKYLKVNNLKEVLPDYSSLSYINKEDINTKDKLLEVGDILFVRVGVTSGVSSIIASKDVRGCFSDNIIRIRLNQDILNPFYCSVFLSSKYGKTLINRHLKGTARPLISYELFEDVLIPIPSPEIQKYIGDKVRRAEELREEAKKLREKNKEILENELELSKLEEIKIDAEKQKNKWIKEEDIEERIDGDFYHPRYNYYDKALFKLDKIGNHFKISKERINRNHIKEIRYIDLSSINNLISPQLMDVKDAPDRAQLKVKEGDVIISTLSGSKKVGIITADLDGCICTTGLVVLRSTSKILTPEYLHAIFLNELFNIQIDKYSSGAIMSGVANSDFEKMRIPIISNKSIVDKISDNTKEHFKKLLEAKKIIQEAKQDVEDLIEGNFNMDKLNESLLESR